MDTADEIIHQSTRLKIVAALFALTTGEQMEFTALKAALNATDGNLGTHLATLETAGYLKIEKDFVGRKPRTRVSLTRSGRRAFERHVSYLREIIEGSPGLQR
ncbi:MAG TPA: transcriptional regulator [Steroidobacteraceae bacterium]|jgi:DNA-binding MarR family transcriptional regulator|nr:transcriptional regulator [Steroidobacteraceae bacterium]